VAGEDAVRTMLKRLLVVVLFSIAFAYIESAVVVYLRAIFHAQGFRFPLQVFDLDALGRRLMITEVGREAATLVLIWTGAWLFGKKTPERWAYFLIIFAVWDIFYYVWLKVLLDWPASVMDWDVLFLIPMVWASPVLYPVLVSLAMLGVAVAVLWRNAKNQPIRLTWLEWMAIVLGCVVIVWSFCLGGSHATEANYADYFYWPLFTAGYGLATGACVRAVIRKPISGRQ
jgi:hypothetical protein